MDDIESKVEQLLEMYMEDRKRLIALLPSNSPGGSPPTPGGGGTDGNSGGASSAGGGAAVVVGSAKQLTPCLSTGGIPVGGKVVMAPSPTPSNVTKLRPILLGKQVNIIKNKKVGAGFALCAILYSRQKLIDFDCFTWL